MPRVLRGLLLAVVLLLTLGATPAAATHVQCGDVITENTTLDSDLSCSGDGLRVLANDVTLDLGGHEIAGAGSGAGVEIETVFPEPLDLSGIAVVDGTVRGFRDGIHMDGPTGTVLDGLVVKDNEIGVDCHYAPGCRVTNSVLQRNGRGIAFAAVDAGCRPRALVARNLIRHNGIGVWIAGCGTQVTRNRIEQNETKGVSIEDDVIADVSRNSIAGNGTDGVYVQYLAIVTISGNQIAGNGLHGIHLDGGIGPYGPSATMHDNRVTRNSVDGIRVVNAYRTVIERNRTERNGDDGVDIDITFDFISSLVGRNVASFNGDLGIEADAGTIDGGGNRARGNGNPAQCVGVSCK